MVATQDEAGSQWRAPALVRGPGLVKEIWIKSSESTITNLGSIIQETTDGAVVMAEAGKLDQVEELKTIVKSIIDLQQQAKINSDVMRAVAELVSGAGVADPEAAFLERYEAALSAYKSKSDPERFAGNEDYKKFREEVWNVTHPGVALPDEGPVDEDADIVVGTQTISLLCPYSKTMLVDPVANPDCNHVYSRANVMSQIPEADGKVECPVVGCQRRFFTRNLVVRKDIAKQVARQKRQREENRDEGSEEEGYETYH